MQLSEIKNDLATINYSPAVNRLLLSDFILIEDSNQSILAQIISIEATMEDDVNSAMLKFLLSIDKDANLTQYSGYVPAKNATIILINPEEVVQLIKSSEKNVHIGNLAAYKDIPVELSLDFLRKKTYVQADFVENKLQIVETIINALEKNNKKAILFDFQGLYESIVLPTVKLGISFKLPLNYDALCYIAEEELNEFSNENKAIIQGILIEVQNYVKTTEDEFIPFDTLISVLDAQYEESPMPELLLLKNKLLKYQQQGLFAQEKNEFDFLDTYLKDSKNFKFDLSEMPFQWHKIAFASIISLLKSKCYLIAELTDENSNKTVIKKLYDKSEIRPILLSSYDYKYQIQIKAMSKNLVLFRPVQRVNDFAGYTSFLNILNQDTFIVWGEQTLFIPLILRNRTKNSDTVKVDKTVAKNNITEQPIVKEEPQQAENIEPQDEEIIQTTENITEELSDTIENIEEADTFGEQDAANTEIVDNILDNIDEPGQDTAYTQDLIEEFNKGMDEEMSDFPSDADNTLYEIEENLSEEIIENPAGNINEMSRIEDTAAENDLPNSDDLDFFFEDENNEVTDQSGEFSEIEETKSTQNENINDDLENLEFDDNFAEDNASSSEYVTEENRDSKIEDDILNSVDNFAEESNNNVPQNQEEPAAIPEDVVTPAVEIKSADIPVYNSNVAPQFDTKFAQGTSVYHQKYGRGIVEKVINHGNKELCFVIFDSVGRRCLDPNLADLKQV